MKDNYEGFLEKLEAFKYDTLSTKEQKDIMIGLFKLSIKILGYSMNYKKLKFQSVTNIELVHDDLLVSFFGNDDILENEKKLNKLKEILKEIDTENVNE